MHCKNSTFIGESLQDWYGKVNDFSVTQVLREITFGGFWSEFHSVKISGLGSNQSQSPRKKFVKTI